MKSLLYILLAALLLAGAAWLIFSDNSSTLTDKETGFAIDDTASVGKILLADKEGNKVILERRGKGWWVNDKFKVRQDAVDLLLETMHKVRVDHPISRPKVENVIKELSTQHKKIEVYDMDGDHIKTYYVGGPTTGYKGTYMYLEGAEEPYVCVIPGFDGFLTTRYIVDEQDLRDRWIIRYQPQNIASVKIKYRDDPKLESFEIRAVDNKNFEVVPLDNSLRSSNQQINMPFARKYMTFFKKLGLQGFENDFHKKDSIISSEPFSTLTITDKNDQQQILKFYYKPVSQRTKLQQDPAGNPLLYDMDLLFILTDTGDFALVQLYVFGKIFRNYSDFILKEQS